VIDTEHAVKVLTTQRDELARENSRLESTIRHNKWKIFGLTQALAILERSAEK
jgi:hypothetical protein